MHGPGEVRLVEVGIPLVVLARLDHVAADRPVRVGEERLGQRRVVGDVGDQAVDAAEASRGALDDVRVQPGRLGEVVVPAEPAGVGEVQVGVDVRDGVQLVQGVADGVDLDAAALGLGALGVGEVGDQVGQAVRLDHGGDADVLVLGVGEDLGDLVDVLALVARQSGGGEGEFAVGGQGGAVAARQVVHHEGRHDRAAGLLLRERQVQVVGEALAARVDLAAVDGGDAVQPDGRRIALDLLHPGLEGRVGGAGDGAVDQAGVVRVDVERGAGERVVDMGLRGGRLGGGQLGRRSQQHGGQCGGQRRRAPAVRSARSGVRDASGPVCHALSSVRGCG